MKQSGPGWSAIPLYCSNCNKLFVARGHLEMMPGLQWKLDEGRTMQCPHCDGTATAVPGLYEYDPDSPVARLLSGTSESQSIWTVLAGQVGAGVSQHGFLQNLHRDLQEMVDRGADDAEVESFMKERAPSIWQAIKQHFREDPLGDSLKIGAFIIGIVTAWIAYETLTGKPVDNGKPLPQPQIVIVQQSGQETNYTPQPPATPRFPPGASFFRQQVQLSIDRPTD